jgi:hypothetical protein
MNNDEFIPQIPPMPQFRNYAQEIHDQFARQQEAMAEVVALNKRLVDVLSNVVGTQQSHSQMLSDIAKILEAQQPPKSSA